MDRLWLSAGLSVVPPRSSSAGAWPQVSESGPEFRSPRTGCRAVLEVSDRLRRGCRAGLERATGVPAGTGPRARRCAPSPERDPCPPSAPRSLRGCAICRAAGASCGPRADRHEDEAAAGAASPHSTRSRGAPAAVPRGCDSRTRRRCEGAAAPPRAHRTASPCCALLFPIRSPLAGSRQGLSFSAAPCFRRRRRCGGSGSLGSGTTHLFEATGRHVVPTVREGGGSASVKGVRGSVSAVVPGWFRLWARCRIRRGRGAEGLAVSVGMCMPECAREGAAAFTRRGSRGAVRQPAQGCRGAVEEPVRAVVPGVWRVTVRSLRRGRSGHRGGGTGARVDARWGQHARGSHPCRSRAAEPLRGGDGEGAAPAAAAVSPALREGYQHPGETGVSALGTRPVRASRERRR